MLTASMHVTFPPSALPSVSPEVAAAHISPISFAFTLPASDSLALFIVMPRAPHHAEEGAGGKGLSGFGTHSL